jgi:hypothetical protein
MKKVDKNQKLPDSDLEGKYPYIQATQTLGGHERVINNTPGDESSYTFEPSGTFEEVNADGQKMTLVADKFYQYINQGSTFTTEAGEDNRAEVTRNCCGDGGSHEENGANSSRAVYGQSADISKGNTYEQTTGVSYNVANEDCCNWYNDANDHNRTKGDQVSFIEGTKYQQITQGEYGIHVPDGNIDFQCDSGKTRIKSGNDILIDSDSKITLKVGSSTIVIESSKITITSPEVEFVRG